MKLIEWLHQVTKIDKYFCCDNCGASAERIKDIEHYATCKRGESKRWEKYYNQPDIVH